MSCGTLCNRFGSVNQAERYRAKLRALHRWRCDSLQFVYQEVRRLMALAFPGQCGTLWEVIARDAFVDALGDQSLKVRVLEKDPMILDEVLKLTCRMEAIARSPPEDDYEDRGRRRDKFARSSAEAKSPRRQDLDWHIERLETLLGEYRQELSRCRDEKDRLHLELRRQQDQGRPRELLTTPERDRRPDPTPHRAGCRLLLVLLRRPVAPTINQRRRHRSCATVAGGRRSTPLLKSPPTKSHLKIGRQCKGPTF